MAVRAITFDFWNTLFRDANGPPRQQMRIDAFAKATGVETARIDEVLNDVWAEFARTHKEEQRTLGPRDAVCLAAKGLDVTIASDVEDELTDVFANAILAYSPVLIEGADEAVRIAAQFGPIAIISDSGVSPGRSLRELLVRSNLADYFAAMVFSDEVGVSKPQRPMFVTAAHGLNVAMTDLLHIGDLEHTDIAGAKAVNAQAAIFGNGEPTHATQADYIIAHWHEFEDIVSNLYV